MKILHIIGGLGKIDSGPSSAVLNLCRHLKSEVSECVLYTTNSDYIGLLNVPLGRKIEYKGINTMFFSIYKPRPISHLGISPSLGFAIFRDTNKYDLIHIHSAFQFTTFVGSLISQIKKIPYIIRPHGSLMPDALKMGRSRLKHLYLKLIGKREIENASAIHFTTEVEKEKTMSLGLKIKKAVIVPNGIDPEEFKEFPPFGEFRKKFPELQDKTIILFLGRITHEKGLDTLIPAFSKIVRKRRDVFLVLAGPDYWGYGEKVKKWIKDYGICDKVIFTGPVYGKDKLSILHDSDIFVLPSYTENFGISAVEAMYSDLPIIITDNVGIYREVAKSEAGLVVQKELEKLCNAMITLIDNKSLRRKLGEKGRRLVEERFTWDKIAKQMVEVYKEIIEERRLKHKI